MIKYKKRKLWKYKLWADYSIVVTGIHPDPADYGYLELTVDNGITTLMIRTGYTWDGPSGPTWDTKTFMRGSLVHDALYQLLREGHLPPNDRKRADEILREICLADGMAKVRAWWVSRGVRIGAKKSSRSDLVEAP